MAWFKLFLARPVRNWLAGNLGNAEAVGDMAQRFLDLFIMWDKARLNTGSYP